MVVLFILSLLGCPAPIVAIVAPCYILPNRATVARAGPVYLIMGYSAIGISVVESILLLLFWLFSQWTGFRPDRGRAPPLSRESADT